LTDVTASSCVAENETVVPIEFAQDQWTWHYHGIGTKFTGQFSKGQILLITGAGSNPVEPWQLTIDNFPKDFMVLSELFFSPFDRKGLLKVTIPETDNYKIVIGPCAAWGTVGDVTVTDVSRTGLPDVKIGLTALEVTEGTRWGHPSHVNRTITAAGTREQWVYEHPRGYLYFRNGVLEAIQD
jgi:hypothetical protein